MWKKILRTFACLGSFKRRGKQQLLPLRIEEWENPKPHTASTVGDNGADTSTKNFNERNDRRGSKQGGLPQEVSSIPISLEDETSLASYENEPHVEDNVLKEPQSLYPDLAAIFLEDVILPARYETVPNEDDKVLKERDDPEPQLLQPELDNLTDMSIENFEEKTHRDSKQERLPQEASCTPISLEDKTSPPGDEKLPHVEDEIELPTGCTLEELTELMLEHDDNNCARFFNYKLQGRAKGHMDESPEPLFSYVQDQLFEVDTIKALKKLWNNYVPDITTEENATRKEIQEEHDFIEACMNTKVMRMARKWLDIKNTEGKEGSETAFKKFLHQMWFTTYPRSHRDLVNGSCAFEHVFLGETKRGEVKGFHNWYFFLEEEKKGNVDYYGFHEAILLSNKGSVIKTTFKWNDNFKPVSSLFLGFSPELELAIYTICALQNPNQLNKTTQISLAGTTINVRTHLIENKRGGKYIGSTFPDI